MANLTDKINSTLNGIYERRRQNAYNARDARVASLYARFPALEDFDTKLRIAGIARLRSVCGIEPDDSVTFDQIASERKAFMREHGIEEGYDDPVFFCRACKDTGRIRDQWCFCRRQILQDVLPTYFPDFMFPDHTFANFNLNLYDSTQNGKEDALSARAIMAKNLEAAKFYTAHFFQLKDRQLFFSGDPGTGKTFLMQCIGHRLMEKGVAVIYVTAPNMFEIITRYRRMQQSFRPDPDQLEDVTMLYNALMTWDLLLVDDLGTEMATQETFSQLIGLLDARQSRQLATIIASNLKMTNFAKQYDTRINSRLKGSFNIYEFPPGDLRLRHLKADV